jgi:HAD superfamily hydrolase (TIGR01549 family)
MFDSFEANLEFYQRIMARMGRHPLSRNNLEEMRVLHTYANREVLAHFFPVKEAFELALLEAGRIDYRELIPLMVMEEGLRETLDILREQVSLAICTNRSTSMSTVLESFNLDGYFSSVMTASRVSQPKPHPEPLLAVLDELGVSAGEVLFVGDSDVDRQAAASAGVPFIAYRTDLPGHARIDRHGDILPLLVAGDQ